MNERFSPSYVPPTKKDPEKGKEDLYPSLEHRKSREIILDNMPHLIARAELEDLKGSYGETPQSLKKHPTILNLLGLNELVNTHEIMITNKHAMLSNHLEIIINPTKEHAQKTGREASSTFFIDKSTGAIFADPGINKLEHYQEKEEAYVRGLEIKRQNIALMTKISDSLHYYVSKEELPLISVNQGHDGEIIAIMNNIDSNDMNGQYMVFVGGADQETGEVNMTLTQTMSVVMSTTHNNERHGDFVPFENITFHINGANRTLKTVNTPANGEYLVDKNTKVNAQHKPDSDGWKLQMISGPGVYPAL